VPAHNGTSSSSARTVSEANGTWGCGRSVGRVTGRACRDEVGARRLHKVHGKGLVCINPMVPPACDASKRLCPTLFPGKFWHLPGPLQGHRAAMGLAILYNKLGGEMVRLHSPLPACGCQARRTAGAKEKDA
jgi:hypothetical protein